MKKRIYIDGHHCMINLILTEEQANIGYHSGDCEDDIEHLMELPEIKSQLESIDNETLDDVIDWMFDDEWQYEHPYRYSRLKVVLFLACGDFVDGCGEDVE